MYPIILVAVEIQTSGRCAAALRKQECMDGPYPSSEYKWLYEGSWPTLPGGCMVLTDTNNVYFNTHVGMDCGVDGIYCICKGGKKI